MNKNSILIICILSILNLSVFVEGETTTTIDIKFEVCSFIPATDPPTVEPFTVPEKPTYEVETVPPTTPPYTGATSPTATSNDDDTEESSSPTTPKAETTTTPNVEVTTPASSENGGDGEGETGETSPAEATTTPETDDKTTTPSEGTEDDSTSENGKADNRGMDDDEEKLISHKRYLAGDEDKTWPKEYTAEQMKGYIETSFKANVDKGKSSKIEVTETKYDESEQSKGKVQYSVTIKVTYENNQDNEKYWEGIRDKIENDNFPSFFGNITEKTEDDYTICSDKPGYLKTETPCSYGKSLYLLTAESKPDELVINPTSSLNGFTISYDVKCYNNNNPQYLTPSSNGDGKVTVDKTKGTTPYSLCNVKCSANNTIDYRNGYTSFTVKVSDNKPTFNRMGSSFPVSVASTRNFTISLKFIYNDKDKLPRISVILAFGSNPQCKVPDRITYTNENLDNGFIKFKDLSIYCQPNDGKLIDIKYQITANNNISNFELINEKIKVKPVIPVVENIENEGKKPGRLDYDLSYATEFVYVCEDKNPADASGLCCDRSEIEINQGKSCTKSTITFPFEVESMNKDQWEVFANSYLDTLRRVVFHKTNFYFNASDIDISTIGRIKITITFYDVKIWQYNPQGHNLVRRSLEGGDESNTQPTIDWNRLSSPYVYINTILSYVNPAAVPEIDSIEDTIPEELKDFLSAKNNEGLMKKLKEAKDEVPKAVAEVTASNSVSLDINEGISTEEVVPDDVTAPKTILVTATSTAQPDFVVPTPGGGDILTDPPKPEDKPWAEEYWWVILIICVGGVLLIGIIIAIIVVSVSSSGSKSSGVSGNSKKDIEKSEKIMETVIPIEKIKQENEISDDDIYKPFSYEVIMEGYLLKEGRDRVLGKWQRRYCVLYFDPAIMRIYDSMVPSYYGKVYLDEKQSIPLDCYNGIEYKDGSSEFTLLLKVRDSSIKSFEAGDKDRKIHLKVEGENSIETAKKWVECFRDFKNQKPKSGEAWTRPLIIDESNGKITTSTSKAAEKKNEDIVMKAQQRRQAHAN